MPIERKLAAIMFTDIAGYTALSAKDENKALELLDTQKHILTPIIKEFNGTLHKEIGDGHLFTFPTVTDAVKCGIKIQEETKSNDDLNLRIGIHEGEITLKDGDALGDDVNIASRIETFAPSGGIAISSKVQQNISSLPEFETSYVGKPELKGVAQEVEVYCITSHGLPKADEIDEPVILESKFNFNIFALTGGILTVIGIAFWIAVGIFDVSFGGKDEVPSIGILMMDNIGGEDDEFWARGITEDLIVKIAGAGLIRVAPMEEIIRISDVSLSIKEKAKTLDVKYLLTSSLHKKDDQFDLRCQLIEVASGNSKYANKWSEPIDKAPTIVGNLADNLLKALKVSSKQDIVKAPTSKTEAYKYYLEANYIYDKSKNMKDIELTKGLLEKAIELDSSLIIAKNKLGNLVRYSGDSHGAMEIYTEVLRQSKMIGDKHNAAAALNSIGSLLLRKGNYDQSLDNFQQSLKLYNEVEDNNGIAKSLRYIGLIYYAKGDYDEDLAYMEKSIKLIEKLNDKRSLLNWYYNGRSLIYNKMGEYTKALEFNQLYMNMSKELESYGNISNALHVRGMIYVLKGEYYKAINVLEESLRIGKEFKGRYDLEVNTLLALSKKNLHQNYDVTEITIMAKDAQSETVQAGSRSVGIDFDLNLWLYQLLEDKFYIDSAYNQIQEMTNNLEPDVATKFLSYTIPKAIVEEWEKVK